MAVDQNKEGLVDECPPFNNFFFPVLNILSDEKTRQTSEIREEVAKYLKLSDKAKLEYVKSGSKHKYMDRCQWATTYLRQAGLVSSPKWGHATITDEGLSFLKRHSSEITLEDLKQFPSFIDFQNRRREKKTTSETHEEENDNKTPEDKIDDAIKVIEEDLAAQILENLKQNTPAFFEKAILDLLIAMGYGLQDSAAVIGKPGDNGIDGIIDQDQLGLDRIYVQAKRHESNISAGDLRDFIGSLAFHQASKGLFVTTSEFTSSAKKTAETVPQRIVLIDGPRLSRLMIEFEVGCNSRKSLSIKQLDRDYFNFPE